MKYFVRSFLFAPSLTFMEVRNMGKELDEKDADNYINPILKIEMQRMLSDVLLENEDLQLTMVAMLKHNPEYICDFISRKIEGSN